MNIVEILKDYPKGTKLYSPICGECELEKCYINVDFPIIVRSLKAHQYYHFTKNGEIVIGENSECLLFPSKDNKDWSTFKPKQKYKFEPFERILVRQCDDDIWKISLYGFKYGGEYCCINTSCWEQCIHYEGNEHLLGTTNNPE